MKKKIPWSLGAVLGLLLLLAFAGAAEIKAQGTIISQYENLAFGGGRLIIQVNVGLFRWNELRVQVDANDIVSQFTLGTPHWTMTGMVSDVEGHRFLALKRQAAGTGMENIVIEGPQGRGRLGIISVFLNGAQQVKVTSQPTFLPIEVVPPPAGGGASPFKRFDIDRDNLISDSEFFAIIDAWIDNQISNELFFQAVDLWVSQRPISAAGVRFAPLTLDSIQTLAVGRSVTFVARGQGIVAIAVEVFALSGRRLCSQQASGSQLTWDLSATRGQPLANGVYLYRVTALGGEGQALQSAVTQLMVRR